MKFAWRLDKARRDPKEAFSGEGARRYGGRWNLPGMPAVYCSETLALAALELFVHIDAERRRARFVHYLIQVPNSIRIEVVKDKHLPRDWRDFPAPISTQRWGTRWLKSGRTAILSVPSVIVPDGRNFVLNPTHVDFRRLKISHRRPFAFDTRMWKL